MANRHAHALDAASVDSERLCASGGGGGGQRRANIPVRGSSSRCRSCVRRRALLFGSRNEEREKVMLARNGSPLSQLAREHSIVIIARSLILARSIVIGFVSE
jgi:hypothetical protein